MSNAAGRLLEDNLDRVVERVFRGMPAVPAVPDQAEELPASDDALNGEQARETMADLCGHVAHALKSLESMPAAVATYRSVPAPVSPCTLDIVR